MWEYPEQYLDERCLRFEFLAEENRLLAEEFRDAAEFESRVTAKLTNIAYNLATGVGIDYECTDLCESADICKKAEKMPCQWCFLKAARIAVEEEMDADQ